jgi:uncharacterized protein YjiK
MKNRPEINEKKDAQKWIWKRKLTKILANSVLVMILTIGLIACSAPSKKGDNLEIPSDSPAEQAGPYPFPYHLDKPDKIQKLPSELVEISGLAWVRDDVLAAVQDEKGNIYEYDFAKDKIAHKIDFAGSGDYEGITLRGDEYWVVRSDGRLYQVEKEGKVKVHDTPLDEDFDVEGLAWQESKNALLLACKGYPGQGKALKDKKTCYSFDLQTMKLDSRPALIIDLNQIASGKKMHSTEKAGEFLDPGKGNKEFQPSGVAVHPLTGDIYIIASVGKRLIVLSPKSKLLHQESLNYAHFDQPEGICFAPDGTLYISSEGRGGKGKIMRFDP